MNYETAPLERSKTSKKESCLFLRESLIESLKILELKYKIDGVHIFFIPKYARESYLKLIKKHHINIGGNIELFQKIISAYNIIKQYIDCYPGNFSNKNPGFIKFRNSLKKEEIIIYKPTISNIKKIINNQ